MVGMETKIMIMSITPSFSELRGPLQKRWFDDLCDNRNSQM